MWSEKGNAFSGLLKNKDFKEERKTKVGLDAIDTSTTLESNKGHLRLLHMAVVSRNLPSSGLSAPSTSQALHISRYQILGAQPDGTANKLEQRHQAVCRFCLMLRPNRTE